MQESWRTKGAIIMPLSWGRGVETLKWLLDKLEFATSGRPGVLRAEELQIIVKLTHVQGFTGSDTGTALPNAKFMLQDEVTHFRSGRFFCIPWELHKAQTPPCHLSSPSNPFLHFPFLPGLSPSSSNLSLGHPQASKFHWKQMLISLEGFCRRDCFPTCLNQVLVSLPWCQLPTSLLSQGF